MNITDKQLSDLEAVLRIQGSKGNWNYDPYMLGIYNGMELMLAIIQDREPKYKESPKKWLKDNDSSTKET